MDAIGQLQWSAQVANGLFHRSGADLWGGGNWHQLGSQQVMERGGVILVVRPGVCASRNGRAFPTVRAIFTRGFQAMKCCGSPQRAFFRNPRRAFVAVSNSVPRKAPTAESSSSTKCQGRWVAAELARLPADPGVTAICWPGLVGQTGVGHPPRPDPGRGGNRMEICYPHRSELWP